MSALTTIRPELLQFTPEQVRLMMPYVWVFGGAVLALVVTQFKSLPSKWIGLGVSVLSLVAAAISSAGLLHEAPISLFNQMMVSDGYSHYFNVLFLVAGAVTIISSFHYLDRESLQLPEYNVLILFSVLGMMLLASATDLVVIFIALEIMSLSVYSLVGFRRADRRSNEAAMKYFILGGAASALFLYGSALVYGACGSTRIADVLKFYQAQPVSPLGIVGAWTVIAGFLFKVASAPFHMWMPDVYEGAPVPVTGFMTTGLKAAVFATFLRLISGGFGFGKAGYEPWEESIHDILYGLAILTMVVGNVIALSQSNLKRMLAYSSIAHTGYLLVGVIAGMKTAEAHSSVVFYLVSYVVMNLGAFVVLTAISDRGDNGLTLQDLSGLSRKKPMLAFSMAAFMLSMAGVPPTAGFVGKYLLFYQAVQAGEVWLVVLSVLCSAISVYYYLRVLVYMYMREPVTPGEAASVRPGSGWMTASVAVLVVLTLQAGVIPKQWVESARRAITSL